MTAHDRVTQLHHLIRDQERACKEEPKVQYLELLRKELAMLEQAYPIRNITSRREHINGYRRKPRRRIRNQSCS